MNRNYKKMIWLSIFLTIMYLTGLVSFSYYFENGTNKKPITVVEEKQINNQQIDENQQAKKDEKIKQKTDEIITNLAAWIYDNNTRVDMLSAIIYADFIYRNTKHPALVIAIITRESNFRPTCRSSCGALGLGQIRPKFWLEELHQLDIGIDEAKDLYCWRKNILAVDYIVSKLLIKFDGDAKKVLKYYVGGNHTSYINAVNKNHILLAKEIIRQ